MSKCLQWYNNISNVCVYYYYYCVNIMQCDTSNTNAMTLYWYIDISIQWYTNDILIL